MAAIDPKRTVARIVSVTMSSAKFLSCILACSVLICGCATYETYNDVQPEELNVSTLWPGLELKLQYADGTKAKFAVDRVTETSIISTDGKEWPKTEIEALTIKLPPNSADCGSLASWDNGRCWKDEVDRKIDEVRRL